jgi:hypothetical protein
MAAACNCNISKQDIPEVEAVIRLITPRLDAHWQKTVNDAIESLMDALDDIPDTLGAPDVDPLVRSEDRDKTLEDLVAILLSLLWERLGAPPTSARLRILNEGGKRLLSTGSRSVGADFDPGTPVIAARGTVATADALLGVRGRASRRAKELAAHIETYLTSKAARDSLAPLPIGDPEREQTWEEELGSILGTGKDTSVPVTVDSWAYRWFNVGALAGIEQSGQATLVVLNNPPNGPDSKTTPFCNWVHGRTVAVSDAVEQLDNYTRVVLDGDAEAQVEAWPFVRATKRRSFPKLFAVSSLPPYHEHCRSVVVHGVITP